MIKVLKCGVFSCILLFLIAMAGTLFNDHNQILVRWNAFYKQPENTIDILFIGSSHSYCSFDPAVFDSVWGGTSYHLGSNSQTVTQAYYNLREAFKYQKPAIVVLEAFSINANNNWQPGDRNWAKESNLDGMRWSVNKMEALQAQFLSENYFYAAFPLYRNHTNWGDSSSFIENWNMLLYPYDTYNGFTPSETVMSEGVRLQYQNMEPVDDAFVIADVNVEHFNKLVALCEENDVRLVVVMAPMYQEFIQKINYESQHNGIKELTVQHDILFIDYNYLYDEVGLTYLCFEDYYSDYHHLNSEGARLTSYHLANLLQKIL